MGVRCQQKMPPCMYPPCLYLQHLKNLPKEAHQGSPAKPTLYLHICGWDQREDNVTSTLQLVPSDVPINSISRQLLRPPNFCVWRSHHMILYLGVSSLLCSVYIHILHVQYKILLYTLFLWCHDDTERCNKISCCIRRHHIKLWCVHV